jgi:hypothetical protein
MTNYSWPDVVGIVGVATIVLAYLGLQLGKLDGQALSYSAANGLGAALILVSLWFDFNLSAFVIEIFWLLISVLGLVRGMRRAARADGPA